METFKQFLSTLYESPSTQADAIANEHKHPNGTVDTWERMEVIEGKGVYVYLKDRPYPVRGCPTPESLAAINHVKRTLLVLLPFAIFPSIFIKKFVALASPIAYPYTLKYEFMNRQSYELRKVLEAFLKPISPDLYLVAASLMAHVFEYDSAYRYRLIDILAETDPYKFFTPRELMRLGRIASSREDIIYKKRGAPERRLSSRVKRLSVFAALLAFFPAGRNLRRAFATSNWANFKATPDDIYWMGQRIDYDFTHDAVHKNDSN